MPSTVKGWLDQRESTALVRTLTDTDIRDLHLFKAEPLYHLAERKETTGMCQASIDWQCFKNGFNDELEMN